MGDRRRVWRRDRLRPTASPHSRAPQGASPDDDEITAFLAREPAAGAHVSDAPELVFVGGTGRSGTTVTAELLGRHSHFADVPIECRFHCNPNGLADVVSGRATPEQFVRLWRFMFEYCESLTLMIREPRTVGRLGALRSSLFMRWQLRGDRARGVARARTASGSSTAIASPRRSREVRADARRRPPRASRRLFYDLLEPVRRAPESRRWVEMSTFTIAAAPELARIFPEARFVHSVRDGRDSGASKTILREKEHHPTDAISESTSGRTWFAGRTSA
jgi:hypothetical protein